MPGSGGSSLLFGLIVTRFAAWLAVKEAVTAQADIDLRLAKAAEFVAGAALFKHLALAAAKPDLWLIGHS